MANKSKTIVLINPPTGKYRREPRCQTTIDTQTAQIYFAPTDLLTYAAILKEKGMRVVVRDYPVEDMDDDTALADILFQEPDAVWVNGSVPTLVKDVAFIARIKQAKPTVMTLLRGGLFVKDHESFMRDNASVDILVREEYEDVLASIADRGLTPSPDIPGILYRDGDRIITTDRYHGLPELDAYPSPDRTLINNAKYTNPYNKKPFAVVQVSKGCPHKCIFCLAGDMSGHRVRYRSPQRVVDEIRECVGVHGISDFLLNGDTLTHSREWMMQFCSLVLSSSLSIRWSCNGRVDTVDAEMLDAMKRAGCWIVGFGVESGSQFILDKIGKRITVAGAKKAIAACKKAQIYAHAFFVIGFPWDTEETIGDTEAFIHEVKPDFLDVNVLSPLYGSSLYAFIEKEGLFEDGTVIAGDYSKAQVRTYTLSSAALMKYRKRLLRRYLLSPAYVCGIFKKIWSGPITLPCLISEGMRIMKAVKT